MISNIGFKIPLQAVAVEASRSCSNNDPFSIVYHQDCREHINGIVSLDTTTVDGCRVLSSLPPKKRLGLDSCANNYSSCNAYHQDFSEHISGFVSPDSTSVVGSRVSSSLPPKKRLRLQESLFISRTVLISPMVRPSSQGSLCKGRDSMKKGNLTDPLESNSRNIRPMNNYDVSESSHFGNADAQLSSIGRKIRAPTTTKRKKESSSEDVFGNSIQMGYFSGANIMISPEKLLRELKNTSNRSDASHAKEKGKPRDQDMFGNAIGMGYFSSIFGTNPCNKDVRADEATNS